MYIQCLLYLLSWYVFINFSSDMARLEQKQVLKMIKENNKQDVPNLVAYIVPPSIRIGLDASAEFL